METWPATTPGGGALKRLSYLASRKLLAAPALRAPELVRGCVPANDSRDQAAQSDVARERRDPAAHVDPLRDLAVAAKDGDQRAVRVLVQKMRTSTALIVRNVLGHSHPALDDVIQEATIAQVSSLKNFRGESTVAHFMSSVALRVALCSRRRLKARRERMDNATLELPPDVDGETPLSKAMDKRSRDAILRILRELPETNAEVLFLHTVFGYSTAELAQMRQVTEGTIRSQMRSAKKEFRRLMLRERRTGRMV